MKQAALVSHRAFDVRSTIDSHRRALAASAVKTMLRAARVEFPEMLDDAWIVYRLADGRIVSYCPGPQSYMLRDGESVRHFSTVTQLVAHLVANSVDASKAH